MPQATERISLLFITRSAYCSVHLFIARALLLYLILIKQPEFTSKWGRPRGGASLTLAEADELRFHYFRRVWKIFVEGVRIANCDCISGGSVGRSVGRIANLSSSFLRRMPHFFGRSKTKRKREKTNVTDLFCEVWVAKCEWGVSRRRNPISNAVSWQAALIILPCVNIASWIGPPTKDIQNLSTCMNVQFIFQQIVRKHFQAS